MNTYVDTVTVAVVVTGASVAVAVEMLVTVWSGIEIKALQKWVAQARRLGLRNTSIISESTWQLERA